MTHMYGAAANSQWLDAVTDFAPSIKASAPDVDKQGVFPELAIKSLADRGFFGLCLPSDCGGKGESPGTFAAVVEQLAMACPSTAMVYVMHVSAAQAIAASRTLAQRNSLLNDIAAGKHLSTLAFSERGSRSQFWAPVSQLRNDGNGGFLTSASKSWVTSANHANSFVSSAQMPGATSPLESTLYLARPGATGIAVAGRFDGLGLRGNDSAPIEITDLGLAPGDLLTSHGEGATMMLQVVLPWFVVGTAAMAHGLCLAAIKATQAHVTGTGFSHDGKLLRDLANIRSRLADMNCQTEQSRALLGFTCQQMLVPDGQTPLYVLQSRIAALEAALAVTDLAMKVCGGAAFSRHLGVEQLFRDARAGWVMAPTVDHLHDFVGRALTGLPLF